MQYKLLISPWKNEFIDIISETEDELFISSPYVNIGGVKILSDSVQTKSGIEVSLITNLTTQNIVNGATEPKALLELYKQFGQVKISSLGRLHAKVYLIDNRIGVITSANLTRGGLVNNFEYGILIEDKNIISTIKEDMIKYYSLGNILDKNFLERVSEESIKLGRIRDKTNDFIKETELAELLKKSTDALGTELLKNRIKDGKTVNEIFSDTILYILKKKSPLSTKELQPLIQSIHPDICDDSIDRVIDGQHFGKKWKHSLRNAQQSLKKRGLIYLEEGKWHLID